MKKLLLITFLSLFTVSAFATTDDKEVNLTFYPTKKLTPTTATILCSSARNHLSIAATQKLDIEAETPFHCSLGTKDGKQSFLITMITAVA
jgi:hypothetical protein